MYRSRDNLATETWNHHFREFDPGASFFIVTGFIIAFSGFLVAVLASYFLLRAPG